MCIDFLPWNAHDVVFEVIQLGASDYECVVAGPAGVEVDVAHGRGQVFVVERPEVHEGTVDRSLSIVQTEPSGCKGVLNPLSLI